MVKVLAEQRGWIATFMPKPFAHLTGNGAHFHMSLWDAAADTPLFDDRGDELGLSPLAYHFIGGLKAHAARTGGDPHPDRQLLQAADRRQRPLRRHLGTGLRELRRQ